MAAKKDFTAINTDRADSGEGAGKVFATIEQSSSRKGQQGEASPEEAAERASELRTQGRKGCKAVRINMAFTPENYQFIQIVSRVYGKTMTGFANQVIERYRKEHPELYEKAKELIEDAEKNSDSL